MTGQYKTEWGGQYDRNIHIRGEIEEIIEHESGNQSTINKLENILEEVQYLSSISQRLLLIHTMDTNQLQYHFESINLSKLLTEIHQDLLILSIEKNITASIQLEQEIYVQGNKELLTRLLWNLVDNAVKYNKESGEIHIRMHLTKSDVRVQIQDSGIGIPNNELSKIFNRFYRVDKSRARQLGGSGLGLSICRWIVELHTGELSVMSEEDSGSIFTISLPTDDDIHCKTQIK